MRDHHFADLVSRYPGATLSVLGDGTAFTTIPSLAIPEGWSKPSTAVGFIVPVGYPVARPDCFFADADLRLKNGSMPNNSTIQTPPGLNNPWLWFSWHLTTWDPQRDSLLTFVRVVRDRFSRAQ